MSFAIIDPKRADPFAPLPFERLPPPAPEPEPKRNRLNEIAVFVRSLTYGEMIQLAEAMWKVKGENEITAETLPGIFHRWSTKP